MSIKITEKCLTCGACEWECPTLAIAPGAIRPIVDENLCTECYGFFGESQCVVVCPAQAISIHRLEDVETLASRFHQNHPDLEAQDTWIWRRI
jgi:ferredoxin